MAMFGFKNDAATPFADKVKSLYGIDTSPFAGAPESIAPGMVDPMQPQFAGATMPTMSAPESIAPTMMPDIGGAGTPAHIKTPFSAPGGLGDKLGTLGAYMLSIGGSPLGGQILRQQSDDKAAQTAFERGEQQYQRARRDHVADDQTNFGQQIQLAEWKRQHPDDQLTQYMEMGNIPQADRAGIYANAAKNRVDPSHMIVDPSTGQPMLVGGAFGYPGQGGPKSALPAIGAVVPDPRKQGGGATGGARPFDSVVAQESGGRVGVEGPQTKYGKAQGLAQLLPATAAEQARKLGVAWVPELMTGTTPQAAAYQRALGESYFNEGLAKTGNMRDALRYYHGGPSRSMWGPKTNAYADQVLGRMGAS